MSVDTKGTLKCIDLQVNGYGGADFNNEHLTEEELYNACLKLDSDSVVGILATIISDEIDLMVARLQNLVRLREKVSLARRIIWGIHIEGPFLSALDGYVGAHPRCAVCPADCETMSRLLDAAAGLTRIVSLAPERDANLAVTRMLVAKGICVSAGHCNPSLDQLDAAIDSGLSMFTHLGNACPQELHRHDNIIQRVLSRADRLYVSLIADGVHLPWHVLGNYIRLVGLDRVAIVSDAISAAGLSPGRFTLGGQTVIVDDQGATWAADRSHLIGSASTLNQMQSRLAKHLSLSERELMLVFHENPRKILSQSESI